MKDSTNEAIASFGEALDASVSSPAKNGSQNINESSPILDTQELDTLHSIVVKLLWVEKVGRPDIEPDK